MASIGPQLPPHLQKRKRTADDDPSQIAPPTKATRRDNEDEIPLDDSASDDDFGPSAAPSTHKSPKPPALGPSIGPSAQHQSSSALNDRDSANQKSHIGSALPPSSRTNEDEIPLNGGSSDSDTGPAPPPRVGPAAPPPSAGNTAARRVLGPAPPPAPLSERPEDEPGSDSDSDSDWGPSLPSTTAGPSSYGPTASAFPLGTPTAAEPAAPKRDDWMVAPPTSSGYRVPDPTKLKNRKFASGRSASDKPSGGVSSIWTETPEEKARRLANAVLGREDPSAAVAQHKSSAHKPSSARRADETKIREFTEQTRGRSLVEEHQAAREAGRARSGAKPEEEDDPSKRAFDWEKDMKVGGQISNSQRRQLLNKAANFGGRFQKGSFL